MIELSPNYRQKVEACRECLRLIGVQEETLLARYAGASFPDSEISKQNAFREVLNCALSQGTDEYMHKACNLTRFRDTRTPTEYAVDLVLGWLIEDAVLVRLDGAGGSKAVLSGHDRFREFLPPRKISTQPDIRIGSLGRLVEVFCDWKDTWQKKGHADLRDNKAHKLLQERAILVGIAPLSRQGFTMDFSSGLNGFEPAFIPAYRKQGYTCKSVRDCLRPLDDVMDAVLRLARS